MTMRSIVPFGWGGSMLPGRAANDDPFVRLWNDVDRLFSGFLRGSGVGEWPVTEPVGLPVEVIETGTEMRIVAELPGVEEKDISVELQGDVLTIEAEKKSVQEHEDESRHITERRYGTFARSLRLPFTVEADQIQATFKNGVLTVAVPKPAELRQEPKRIEVKAAA